MKSPTVIIDLLFVFSGGSAGLNVKTQPESRCPELLANFCDMLLRKTPYSKKLTSDEIQAKLKDVVSILFSYKNEIIFFFTSHLRTHMKKASLMAVASACGVTWSTYIRHHK